jgi:hypothetical protein
MTMEYVGFTIFIAASGVIFFWFMQRFVSSRKTAGAGKAQQLKSDAPRLSIPPVKRTISGPRQEDLEYVEFVNRTDFWNKDREVRPEIFSRTVGTLSGTPYTPEEKRAAV